MLAKIFVTLMVCLMMCTKIAHAKENNLPRVAVIDFGQLNGAMTGKLNTDNVGAMCIDYIIEALTESGKFFLIDRHLVAEKLAAENLDGVTGHPSLSTIRKLGEILDVDFLIIGKVYGVGNDQTVLEILSNGAKVNSVKANLIARMVDAHTGEIVAVANGTGESKSSLVKFSKDTLFITIGTKNVPQVSVLNSIRKATTSLVEELLNMYSDWRDGQ